MFIIIPCDNNTEAAPQTTGRSSIGGGAPGNFPSIQSPQMHDKFSYTEPEIALTVKPIDTFSRSLTNGFTPNSRSFLPGKSRFVVWGE